MLAKQSGAIWKILSRVLLYFYITQASVKIV